MEFVVVCSILCLQNKDYIINEKKKEKNMETVI